MTDNNEKHPALTETIEELEVANANPTSLATALADITRRIMRASISYDHSQVYHAAHEMASLIKSSQMTKELNAFNVVDGAIDQLTVKENHSSLSYPDLHLAQIATQYLIEKSSKGGYLDARQRRSQERLQSAVKHYEQEVNWRIDVLKSR